MNYKVIIQAHVGCDEKEIIGVKEQITAALEHFGCAVDYINVMSGEAPKVKAEPKRYYKPEEVKNMSREEIRKNYDAILASMEKWN